jgi:hypothetical protein
MEGVVFGESPRWHDGRLWFSDWGANQVIALARTSALSRRVDSLCVLKIVGMLPGRPHLPE